MVKLRFDDEGIEEYYKDANHRPWAGRDD